MTEKKNNIKYLFFAISAALLLMLASRSSFMYIFNNWDDANSYFSMGKALFNGKMPYRDVFDQKGMYLYFLYGLCYLVSHTTFIGVYILEVILGSLDIIGFYKILRLYLGERLSFLFAPLSFAVIVISKSFWWGGAAEELCLPLYVWGMYLVMRYFRKDYAEGTMSFKHVFIGGILAGFVANMKFTGLGFFFAWMALVFFAFLAHRELVNGIKACCVFLFGMFLPFVPWVIYFGVQKSLYEWYWGYVYINVFLYPNTSEGGVYEFVYSLSKILYWLILDNLCYFIPLLPGLLYTFIARKQKGLTRLAVIVLFGFMFLGIFVGGRTLPYYSLPLGVFAVFGFAFVGHLMEAVFPWIGERDNITTKNYITYVIMTALAVFTVFRFSMNIPFMSESKDNYYLYRFRDEVLEKDNPTLLNINALDIGLYTLTDIVPSCRWFQTQTLDVPEKENNPYAEQARYITEGLTDFVIARDYYPNNIFDKYELIDEATYSYSGYDFIYYLFRKK